MSTKLSEEQWEAAKDWVEQPFIIHLRHFTSKASVSVSDLVAEIERLRNESREWDEVASSEGAEVDRLRAVLGQARTAMKDALRDHVQRGVMQPRTYHAAHAALAALDAAMEGR